MRVPLDYQTSASLIQEKKYLVQRGETRSLKLKLAFAATKLSRQTNHRLLLFSFFKQYAVRNRWVGGKIRLTLFLYCPTSSFPSCINAPVGAVARHFAKTKDPVLRTNANFSFRSRLAKPESCFSTWRHSSRRHWYRFFFFLFQRLYAVPPEEMTTRKRRLVAQTAPNLNLLRHILHAVDNKTMIEGRAREYRTRTKTIDDRFLFQFRSMNGPVQHKVTKREDKWSSRSQNGAREKFNIVCVATADGH